MDWLKEINDNYANAVSALTPFVIGMVSWFYYRIFVESQTRTTNTIYISPSFWSPKQNHRIDTVKRFRLTQDTTGYEEIETLYTQESWSRIIEIRRRWFRTTIVPRDDKAILIVTIKRHPHEHWKNMYFNR